jgi:hypothetical protein
MGDVNTSSGGWNATEMAANLQRLAALGLRISLTEVDIRIPVPTDTAHVAEQKREYQTLMSICLAQPNCKTFVTWGVNDAQSWIPGKFSGYGSALLFDNNYAKKTTYDAVTAAFNGTTGILQAQNGRLKWIRPAGQNAMGTLFDLSGRRMNILPNTPTFMVSKPVSNILVH